MLTCGGAGLTLNYGVLISWSCLHGSLALPALLLYAACALHTVFYDTVYSHQVLQQTMQYNPHHGEDIPKVHHHSLSATFYLIFYATQKMHSNNKIARHYQAYFNIVF